jgi:hypothetical protein
MRTTDESIRYWEFLEEHTVAIVFLGIIGFIVGFILWGVTHPLSLEEQCLYSSSDKIKIVYFEQKCMQLVDKYQDDGFNIQRYGIKGHDLIVMEKSK